MAAGVILVLIRSCKSLDYFLDVLIHHFLLSLGFLICLGKQSAYRKEGTKRPPVLRFINNILILEDIEL